jgi:diaminohydroxyphosphoribosylaminopyrimidine deaminase/5-amino-6-(5-phosphoribosylamino)uracil reductase
MLDPFAQVAGQGAAQLRSAGVEVEVGLCEDEARRVNRPYLTLLGAGRPYVHAKWAMSLDGKIATHTGDAKWISNKAAQRRVHELRGRMDAIICGINTVLADDPLLTVRPPGPRTPLRIVLDSQGRLPLDSKLAQSTDQAPVMVVSVLEIPPTDPLRQAGCEMLTVKGDPGRPSVSELLKILGQRRLTNVLVEGGAQVLGSFFDAGLVDEVWTFIAPIIIGGTTKSAVGGNGVDKLAAAMRLGEWNVETIEDNVLMHGVLSD